MPTRPLDHLTRNDPTDYIKANRYNNDAPDKSYVTEIFPFTADGRS